MTTTEILTSAWMYAGLPKEVQRNIYQQKWIPGGAKLLELAEYEISKNGDVNKYLELILAEQAKSYIKHKAYVYTANRRSRCDKWNQEDILFIKNSLLPVSQMAKHISRTCASVRHKLWELNKNA